MLIKKIVPLIFLGFFVFGLVTWYSRSKAIGTRHKITDKESVNYSGDATEADADSLGKMLVDMGYFDNQNEKDVLLRKDTDGTSISFVVQDGVWDDPNVVSAFESVGRQVAQSLGGPPLNVDLIDDSINLMKRMVITKTETSLKASETESVRYLSPATPEQASALVDALKAIDYFDGGSTKDVYLDIASDDETQMVSVVVQDGVWEDVEMVAAFERFGVDVATHLGLPIEFHIIDSYRNSHFSKQLQPGEIPAEEVPAEEAPQPAE
ncbi:hypothetical protein [Stieleria varia]|uniref:Uncharacterized protein n=1 Tax=Stieleria varia TaxID=2528005 RepID=A0A5C5ZVR7_9BACT|nr:hypothetical protein [Stieleria varia]TWT91256.1 hypothetical protein Pla52n_66680 [Stieleria varia]